MNKILKAAVGASLFGLAGAATADNFFLCPPAAGAGNCTDVFEQMTFFVASESNYTDTDGSGSISVGDAVLDVGSGNISGFQPFTFGSTETQLYGADPMVGGWILNVGFNNLTQVVVDVDDSSPGTSSIGMPDGEGQIGETVGVAALVLGGTIDLFYNDGGGDRLVAQLSNLAGDTATIGDVVITAGVDFGNVAAADVALAQGLFLFENGQSWYDLWNAGGDMTISARVDSNVDQLDVLAGNPGFDFLRETELDGSVRFAVPAPGPLALLGLGLLGAGYARRKVRA